MPELVVGILIVGILAALCGVQRIVERCRPEWVWGKR